MYSQYNLIEEEIKVLTERRVMKRFFMTISKTKRFSFKINVANELYQRADTLCDDIVQLRKEDIGYDQSELAEHIFLDFLDEVRKNDENVWEIYTKIKVRKQDLPMINDHPIIPSKSSTKLEVFLDREDVLRTEVFLQDLSHFAPNHGLDVRELIEIVYLDFLLEYSKGRRKKVMKEIIDYFEE